MTGTKSKDIPEVERWDLYDGKRIKCPNCFGMIHAPWPEYEYYGGCLWCGTTFKIMPLAPAPAFEAGP